jgi:hypothetical protein
MKSPIWFGVSLLAIASCGLAGASDHSPCDLHRTRTGWHVFVDDQDRFCFEYPREYHVAPTVFAPGVSTGDATRFIGRLTTAPSPSERASPHDPKNATINAFAYGIPFRLEDLAKRAPTGDSSPQLIHAVHGDFYYYGRGGGGVDYPDVFYFGIRAAHTRLNSLDRTQKATSRTQQPRELSQRLWQVSIHSECQRKSVSKRVLCGPPAKLPKTRLCGDCRCEMSEAGKLVGAEAQGRPSPGAALGGRAGPQISSRSLPRTIGPLYPPRCTAPIHI